jgi:hypothetical protein
MRTHVERDADSKARQGTPAGSATAGVNVIFLLSSLPEFKTLKSAIFFSLFFWLARQKVQKCKTSKEFNFLGWVIVLVTVFGDTHLPYDGVQPTAETRFHLCIVVFRQSSSYDDRYIGVRVKTSYLLLHMS